MNRITFMKELEELLKDIPENEREEALKFYNDYFHDAGEEYEDKVIQELESPAKVALIIKSELKEGAGEEGEFSERGYEDARFRENFEVSQKRVFHKNGRSAPREEGDNNKTGKIILIVIFCFMAIPVGVPLAVSVFGILIGIAGIMIGVIATAAGIAISLLISGIVVIVLGMIELFVSPAIGLLAGGIGCILISVGLFFTIVTLWIGIKFIPWIVMGVINLCKKPFRKRGGSFA